jgi:hypothetical protein
VVVVEGVSASRSPTRAAPGATVGTDAAPGKVLDAGVAVDVGGTVVVVVVGALVVGGGRGIVVVGGGGVEVVVVVGASVEGGGGAVVVVVGAGCSTREATVTRPSPKMTKAWGPSTASAA